VNKPGVYATVPTLLAGLARRCPECEGAGRAAYGRCPACDGCGLDLTPDAREAFEFLFDVLRRRQAAERDT
jgi:uncharacterized protein (DUF983 family)